MNIVKKFEVKDSGFSWSGQHTISYKDKIYTCVVGGNIIEYHEDEIILKDKSYNIITYEERMKVKEKIKILDNNYKKLEEESIKTRILLGNTANHKDYDKLYNKVIEIFRKIDDIIDEQNKLYNSIRPKEVI